MSPKPPAVMQTAPWQDDLATRVAGQFPVEPLSYLGQNFFTVPAEQVAALLNYLRDQEGFDYLVDLTAVDYPKREQRFDLVYILYSFSRNERIRVKTLINAGQKPQTASEVYPTANWLERECYDMFGIEFEGHPDLRRILMPDDWQGFPLRKDYGILQMDQRWVRENLNIESGQ